MKKSLDEILFDYRELEKELIESEGVVDESLEEKLNINRNEFAEKLNGYYYISEKLKAEASFDEEQEKRFAQRKKTKLNAAQRLKDRIDMAMVLYAEPDSKSKAKIPSLKFETDQLKATAVAYPVIKPESIPSFEYLEAEIPGEYLDYKANITASQEDAKLLVEAVTMYNEKVGSKTGKTAIVPELIPQLNTTKVKDAIKDGVSVGNIELTPNFKTKFS